MKITTPAALAAAAAFVLSLGLTACGSGAAAELAEVTPEATGETVKMCVLVSDATSSEAIDFKAYYTEYIQPSFNVQFVYSDELPDIDAEKLAMETFIADGCQAIISFSSLDRPAQIQMAEDAGVYYSVATGALTDEQYEQVKGFTYYVGAIGPSLGIERLAGYDMAQHFIAQGSTRFAIFGGGIPSHVNMHIYRTAGMLAALAEESSTTYGGVKEFEQILGKIMQDGTIVLDDFVSDAYELTGYHELWNFDDPAWQANMAAVVASQPDVILAAGSGLAVFGEVIGDSGVTIGDVGGYSEANGLAMDAGSLTYLAGKFLSSTGPIFAATLSAVQGHPIRAEGDTAFALEQGYWVATSADLFNAFLATDSIVSPGYSKATLEPYIGTDVSYDDFATFVSKYTFEDLSE